MTAQPPLTRRTTVSRGEVDLAVFEGGNPQGPTILMVHGWPDTHHLWNAVAEILASEFRVVAYDTRGQGESPTTAPDEAFTLDELAADLLAVVDDVGEGAPVHVLAHDWGSVQAWEAVCRPGAEQRISSFTSMSGPNLAHVSSWARSTLRRPTLWGLAGVAGQVMSSSYIPFLVSPLATPVLSALATRERWQSLLRATEGRPAAADGHADTLTRDMVSGLRYYRANLLHAQRRDGEQTTQVPVLQLALLRDLAVRPASLTASDRFTERLERRELPYGHWVALTHPDVVADEVARFVRAVG